MPTSGDELPEFPTPPPNRTLTAAAVGGFIGAVIGAAGAIMVMNMDDDDEHTHTGYRTPVELSAPVAIVERRHV